ncbi:MAG: T9SS type A sorting domain-containing protein [Flavobacteriales bacterium]|nr:T9SS type A sorting domain-containing protein [Flavobacteriales bacterium]
MDTCGGFNIPNGYIFPDQDCALEVVTNDPFCLETAWDDICQDAYNSCLLDTCFGALVYLPDGGPASGLPAILFCPGDTTDLTGYTLADNQDCAYSVVAADPFCLESQWDGICQNAYDDCVCALYELAPTDLTKSFDPVNGVRDRVQVKWFKAEPEVRYTDKDAAMCDIEFWPKRNLDPETGNPIGPVIVNPDTTLIENAKKTYGDGSPRSIFKWPVKFRADGANNNKRAEPNIRYEWRVRCECGHDGFGPESPWSDVKIFNTPDFDPSTGIFNDPVVPGNATKSLANQMDVSLFPNPNDGSGINLQFSANSDVPYIVEVVDMTGRVIHSEQVNVDKARLVNLNFGDTQLQNGMYMLNLLQGDVQSTLRFVVK